MTYLTNKQQEELKHWTNFWRNFIYYYGQEEFEKRMESALSTFHGPYQPTCMTEEVMRKCENTNK